MTSRWWRAVWPVLLLGAVARCSSGSGGGALTDGGGGTSGPGGPCQDSYDCPRVACECANGMTGRGSMCRMNRCPTLLEVCDTLYCSESTTVSAVEVVRRTVVGTPECQAYCGRVEALACPDGEPRECNEQFWCEVRDSECEAQARARLGCAAEQGVFECSENGWHGSNPCPDFDELCAPDGGAEGGAGAGGAAGAGGLGGAGTAGLGGAAP